jgi:hypothetical protein
MVERKESTGIDRFDGVVTLVEKVPDKLNAGREQYHIAMKPNDTALLSGTKTGQFHEWIGLSATSSEKIVAEGSVLDNFLKELEAVIPKAKKAETVTEALKMLEGKKMRFIKKVLGKSFEGKQAQAMFVPSVLLE